jgi:hypothetical protein
MECNERTRGQLPNSMQASGGLDGRAQSLYYMEHMISDGGG